jgi:hypothetical protein
MARSASATKIVTVPGALRQACDEFNSGRFFACHETLEEVWLEEQGAVRDCYKGLIQLAAAFVHVGRGNAAGARRLLTTATGYLEPYRRDGALGIDIDALCVQAARALDAIVRDGIDALDPTLVPHLGFDDALLRQHAVRDGVWGFAADGAPLPMTIRVVD